MSLCFSAFQCHHSLPTQNRQRPINCCTCRSHLQISNSPLSFSGLSPSQSNHLLMQPHNGALHPLCQTIKPDGLQALQKSLQQRHVSGKAIKIILKSWLAGTQKQYRPYITQWIDFCDKRESSPSDLPLTAV